MHAVPRLVTVTEQVVCKRIHLSAERQIYLRELLVRHRNLGLLVRLVRFLLILVCYCIILPSNHVPFATICKGFLYVIRFSRPNLTTKRHFSQKSAQRYNNFSRYANKILILIGNVLFPAYELLYSLSNLKIYLFKSKKSCNFAPIFMVCET